MSLIAEHENKVVGHILLTRLLGPSGNLAILCPLAVLPDAQNMGVGAALIKAAQLASVDLNIAAICVLGAPGYYGRFGFSRLIHWALIRLSRYRPSVATPSRSGRTILVSVAKPAQLRLS